MAVPAYDSSMRRLRQEDDGFKASPGHIPCPEEMEGDFLIAQKLLSGRLDSWEAFRAARTGPVVS